MSCRWLVVLGLSIPFASCGQRNTDLDQELKTLLKNTVPVASLENLEAWKTAVLLDTRERDEFEVSHISTAKCVGYDDFDLTSLEGISIDDTLIVYCSVGYRSERIGEKLKKAGYKHVYNLYGGIFNWKNNDGIVVTSSNDTTENVHTYNKKWGRFLKKGQKVY